MDIEVEFGQQHEGERSKIGSSIVDDIASFMAIAFAFMLALVNRAIH